MIHIWQFCGLFMMGNYTIRPSNKNGRNNQKAEMEMNNQSVSSMKDMVIDDNIYTITNSNIFPTYFVHGYKVTLLFKQWKTINSGEMIVSCFAFFVLFVVYEVLKKTLLVNWLTRMNVVPRIPIWRKLCCLAHLTQTFLYMIQVFIAY